MNDLVSIQSVIPDVILDIRYATDNNFTGKVLYESSVPLLRTEPLNSLQKVADEFHEQGVQIVIWDGYRPKEVQEKLRQACSDDRYVSLDSNHCKGITVDMTLARDGEYLDMGTDYDKFNIKSHADAVQLSEEQIKNRSLLRETMEKYGFSQYDYEWWHFDYQPSLKQENEIKA